MAEVALNINGRTFNISCEPGQEQRVLDLGAYVDSRLRDIASAGAATTEPHLLVLTSLLLADEIFELRDNPQNIEGQLQSATANENNEAEIAGAIDQLADRIDQIATRIKTA